MKRLQLRLAKWLLRRLDYQYVAIKQIPTHNTVIKHNVYTEIPTLFIEGDNELLKYVDTTGFLTKKEPLRRAYNVPDHSTAIQKLPAEVVAEIVLLTEPFPAELQKQNETID